MLSELIEYRYKGHSHIAAQVYFEMQRAGELDEVVENLNFREWVESLQEAAFCEDERGPWLFVSTRPWLDGAIFGIWVRPDKRRSKDMVYMASEAYTRALQKYKLLIGYTKRPLQKMHQKMGYRLQGKIPGLWNGEDVQIWTLRREDFVDWRVKLWGIK